jgi:biopolymer transport protein ExbD
MHVADGRQKRNAVICEINITPLTDIFLVLLIIMMVVAPMVQQMHSEIRPPEITTGAPVPKSDLTVEISKDGKFFVDGIEAYEADLVRLLRDKADRLDQKKVTIRADRAAKGHAVMAVFDAAQQAELEKITVIGEVPMAGAESKPTPETPPASETPETEAPEA